jgi:hypothetical protein
MDARTVLIPASVLLLVLHAASQAGDSVPPEDLRQELASRIEQGADEYRPIPVEQLDRHVGERVRVHVIGEGVREGTLLEAQNGVARIEQQRGSGVMTVSFKTRRIAKAELPLDPSTPIRGNGAMSVMNFEIPAASPTPVWSSTAGGGSSSGGGGSSRPTLRGSPKPMPRCPNAR